MLLSFGRNPLIVRIRSTRVRVDTIFFGNFLCLKCEGKGKRSLRHSVLTIPGMVLRDEYFGQRLASGQETAHSFIQLTFPEGPLCARLWASPGDRCLRCGLCLREATRDLSFSLEFVPNWLRDLSTGRSLLWGSVFHS